MDDNRKLNGAEAARLLGLPYTTFRDWVHDGTIHEDCVFKQDGKTDRYILGKLKEHHANYFPTLPTDSTTATESAS